MSHAPFITSQTVLNPASVQSVNCPLCAKIVAACDGRRTLRDIAQSVYLPLAVCQKLVQKALANGWVEFAPAEMVITNTELFWQELEQALGTAMGSQAEQVLAQAARMTGQVPGDVAGEAIPDLLIAVEMHLPETQRFQLVAQLDSLRTRYAC